MCKSFPCTFLGPQPHPGGLTELELDRQACGRQGYAVGQGSERERTRGWVTSVVGKRPGMVLTRQVL